MILRDSNYVDILIMHLIVEVTTQISVNIKLRSKVENIYWNLIDCALESTMWQSLLQGMRAAVALPRTVQATHVAMHASRSVSVPTRMLHASPLLEHFCSVAVARQAERTAAKGILVDPNQPKVVWYLLCIK